MAARPGHVGGPTASLSSLPWGAAALDAARRGPGLLAIVVDAAWTGTALADQRSGRVQAVGSDSAVDRQPENPMSVVVDRDALPAVALRVRWTLRLFDTDEALPHAALYAVQHRGGRLLPLLAAGHQFSMAVGEVRDQLARWGADRREAERRAARLRRALAASARRGWRVRRPLLRHFPAAAVAAVKAALDPAGAEVTAAPGRLRPTALALLLSAARQGDDAAAALVHQTLGVMARGGVRDQLDGGFFQDARDPGWRLPDFARTASLNAALLGVYSTAAAHLSEPTFADVARGIGRYLLSTLRDTKTGGFFASQAVEESHYTWTSGEVTAALPVDLVQVACMHFNVQPAARVVSDPRKNVLYIAADADAIARFIGQPVAAVVEQLEDVRAALLTARAEREPPRLDCSHYVDVNAQVVAALLTGARSLLESSWQTTALQTLAWLEEVCFRGDTATVPHRLDADSSLREPYLGDYAALGRALLDAHGCTGEPRYLARAEAVAAGFLAQLRDQKSGALLDTPRDSLVGRAFWPEQPLEDLAGPSPTATAVGVLLDLYRRTRRTHYHQAAGDVLRCAAVTAAEDPVAAASYSLALTEWFAPSSTPAPGP